MTDPADILGARLAALRDDLVPRDLDLAGRVKDRLDQPRPTDHRRVLVAAAMILLVAIAIVTIPPARRAVASLLGIGNTTVEIVDELPAATPITIAEWTLPATDPDALPSPDTALTGPLVSTATRDLDGVTETIQRFAEVSLSSTPTTGSLALARKSVPTDKEVSAAIMTDGEHGLWIEGPHTRTIGPFTELVPTSTLIWVRNELEFRLTGDLTRAEAVAIAESLG